MWGIKIVTVIKKITPNASRAIDQYIRRNPTISAKSIAENWNRRLPLNSIKAFE